jgi:hypothetical protein
MSVHSPHRGTLTCASVRFPQVFFQVFAIALDMKEYLF